MIDMGDDAEIADILHVLFLLPCLSSDKIFQVGKGSRFGRENEECLAGFCALIIVPCDAPFGVRFAIPLQ